MAPAIDRAALHRTIAVLNGKGGVGKTSITANLGGLFSDAGYRVLLVDLDPQGNLGNDLGYLGAGLGDGGEALSAAGTAGTAPRSAAGSGTSRSSSWGSASRSRRS